MTKKLTLYTLLLSMALHCGCRLGLLNQLYQKRHQIAYTIGLIAEIPIAMCSSDHDFSSGIHIEDQDDYDKNIPAGVFQTNEINLFFEPHGFWLNPEFNFLKEARSTSVIDNHYLSPGFSIFHPPSLT